MPDSHGSRREFLGKAGGVAAAAALGPAALAEAVAEAKKNDRGERFPHPKTPQQALQILLKGNKRYRKGKLELRDYSPVGEDRASKQAPFAAIVTCSDSRVSPTLIFDVERGNIFVSKVAGNSVDVGTLGSTEYAIKVLGVKVVLVMGHSDCGAVKSAISVADGTASYPPERYGAIGAVVQKLVPPIETVPPPRPLATCVAVNAQAQATDIRNTDPIVKPAADSGQIWVVPAVYEIKTGKVSLV